MNPPNKDGWHPPPGAPQSHPGVEQLGQQQSRPIGSYGESINPTGNCRRRFDMNHAHHSSLRPSTDSKYRISGPYHPVSQQSGHTLPTLADITHGPPPHQQPPRYGQQTQQPIGGGHSLPGINQSMPHSSPQSNIAREREREPRDRELLERQREMHREEEIMQREREMRERDREQAERYHREQQQHHPVQSHAGSIPIHQPVASKVPNSIHGPNGLLSNINANASNNPQSGVQPSNPSANLFAGGQVQHGEGPQRQYLPAQVQGPPPQSFLGLPGNAPAQAPGGVANLSQGQQPILNDALSYLDQVKVRFVEQPDVYNRFLDIMKDFKSQAIDTPGVIQRVSALFNGHPALIQGFNTFLPAGYRIECGTDENPDAIRVTTPSGTNTISMQGAGRPFEPAQPAGIPHHSRQEYYNESRPDWQQPQPHPQQMGQEGGPYSPKSRMMQTVYGQQGAQHAQQEAYEYQRQQEQQAAANAAALAHQQEQQGVSQLRNAASAAAGGPGRPSMMQLSGQTPGPAAPVAALGGIGMQGGQPDASKRGPVEFNHAISYVNKIKNRFADTPDVYKQFLEILQTYQRESKPIQDVYSQVTILFSGAPDLLEDFKQFLPESAAHAKQQALGRTMNEDIPISNLRGEPGYGAAAQGQAPRGDVKMPPLGQFNVKDSSKDGKKRPRPSGAIAAGTAAESSQAARGQAGQVGNANKRTKLTHKPTQPEVAVAAPSLVPAEPAPIAPTHSLIPTGEEYSFFDRVKKYISNKQNFAEFLKLCNLYAADLIDRNILINRAAGFIGGNHEVMAWFKRFIKADPQDEIIEPKPKVESEVVNLAHCRALGPSYRLLPKRERQKPCSGRDELCQSVLNDEWASHPTWASEDSGFVAHKKNSFEDQMHRIEEDRHDYDHHIEAAIRTQQLMEPLVSQIEAMSEAERAAFRLPRGLGGQSDTIYRRVIKKMYDRQAGDAVLDAMFENPCAVLPQVFHRLKGKLEEWKALQREWDKVWREQMQKGYYKSLDHQSIINKGFEKKLYTTRNFQTELQAKIEESTSLRNAGYQVQKHHFQFAFEDMEVVLDTARLIIMYLDHNTATFGHETPNLINTVKRFVTAMFDLNGDAVVAYMNETYESNPATPTGDESVAPGEETVSAFHRVVTMRKKYLLSKVLKQKDGENARSPSTLPPPATNGPTPSQPSTPRSSLVDPPTYDHPDPLDIEIVHWVEHPTEGNTIGKQKKLAELDESYDKEVYRLYGNLSIYCFIRSFESLYSRLLRIKSAEKSAHECVKRSQDDKPAFILGMIDKSPDDLLYDTSPSSNLYHQVVRMAEEVIAGEYDPQLMEEAMRRYYLKHGWQLYNTERLMAGVTKAVALLNTTDSKDKTADILSLMIKHRETQTTRHSDEIKYRKHVQRLSKDQELYKFTFDPRGNKMYIQYLTPEDASINSEELTPEARWSYYVSAYAMSDPTEGVQFDRVRMPFLKRNMTINMDSPEERAKRFTPVVGVEGLVLRIHTESYSINFEPKTVDWFYHVKPAARVSSSDADGERTPVDSEAAAVPAAERAAASRKRRRGKFLDKFVNNPAWAQEIGKDELEQATQRFRNWVGQIPKREGDEPVMAALPAASATAADTEADADATDVDMTATEAKGDGGESAAEEKKSGDDDTEMADA